MRAFQFIGLTSEAEDYLDEHCSYEPEIICPDCGKVIKRKKVVIDTEHVESFYTDGPDLSTYRLRNGGLIKEIIQAEPWNSGPVCFLCLELEDGTRIGEWTESEIELYGG